MCLSATHFYKSENNISPQWLLNVNISMVSVFAGAGLLLCQEKRTLTLMRPVGSLTEEHIILPSDSAEQNCIREGCHRGTVVDILKMLSLQCSFCCEFT